MPCTVRTFDQKLLYITMKMMLLTWFFLLFVNPATVALQDIWKFTNDSSVSEKIMKIMLESCYENESSSNQIVIFGDFNEFIDKSSIIRLDNSLDFDEDYGKHQFLTVGTNRIVLIADSPHELQSDLISLEKGRWWNHMTSLFVIVKNDDKCEHFEEILLTTWKMDLINSIYICSESGNRSLLYTLNPIADYAPYPWKRNEKFNDLNVFHQVFNPNVTCINLNYDKTKFLDGYEVTSAAWTAVGDINDLIEHKLFHSIITSINASLTVESFEDGHAMVAYVRAGLADLIYHTYPLEIQPTKSFLFPHWSDQIIVIVKMNPELSTLQKILHLWSPPVLFSAAIVLMILLLTLTIKNRDFFLAILDLTRLLTYTSIRSSATTHSFRIYFTTMLIFMVISNGVFQGRIAAFLSTRERVKTVETIDELIDLGYKFYGYRFGRHLMSSRYPKFNVTETNGDTCIDYVLNGTSNACIWPLSAYKGHMLRPLDHIKEPLGATFVNINCRQNWPLHDRINHAFMRLVESGLFNFWAAGNYHLKQKRLANDFELTVPRYRPVKLYKLDFAFKLLAIGLSLATITFFFEWKNRGIVRRFG